MVRFHIWIIGATWFGKGKNCVCYADCITYYWIYTMKTLTIGIDTFTYHGVKQSWLLCWWYMFSLFQSPSFFFLQLNQQCEDRSVLRYVYYYLARILSDTGAQGLSTGGGIPTPNWDALADIDAVGGVTRADVVPRIVEQLTAEASNADVECKVVSLFNFSCEISFELLLALTILSFFYDYLSDCLSA